MSIRPGLRPMARPMFKRVVVPIDDRLSLREHKYYAAYNPDMYFSKYTGSIVRCQSTAASLGHGIFFFNVGRSWLNGKKFRINWHGDVWPLTADWWIEIWDGEYDRSSNTDFPSGAPMASKGDGLLQTLQHYTALFPWSLETFTVSIGGTQEKCMVKIWLYDAWSAREVFLYIDYLAILDASDNVLWSSHILNPVVMEATGTYGDYGYVMFE